MITLQADVSIGYRATAGKFLTGPVMPVTIRVGQARVELLAVLDTGAEHTAVNLDYARLLGLQFDLSNETGVTGVGGSKGAFPSRVHLSIELDPDSFIGASSFHPIALEVLFVEGIERSLLGRDFFSHYMFAIDEKAERYYLGPPGQRPDASG